MDCARWFVAVRIFLLGRREAGHRQPVQRIVGDEIARDVIVVCDEILLMWSEKGFWTT
jgi:hypothetical protein